MNPGPNVRPEQPTADAANPGLIRPPFVYLGSIGLGLLVHLFWPAHVLPASASLPVGVFVVLAAGALFISAVRTFRRAGTPVPGNVPTTTIVRGGPYGFSRNPIYLAFTLFQVGRRVDQQSRRAAHDSSSAGSHDAGGHPARRALPRGSFSFGVPSVQARGPALALMPDP